MTEKKFKMNNADVRMERETKRIIVIPRTEEKTTRGRIMMKQLVMLASDTSAKTLGEAVAQALKISSQVPELDSTDSCTMKDMHALGVKEKNWNAMNKNWYEVVITEEIGKHVELRPARHEGIHNWGTIFEPRYILPLHVLTVSPENIGKVVFDAFEYIDQRFRDC